MKRAWVMLLLMVVIGCGDGANLCRLLPETIQGWSAEAPDGLYDAESLYDYIDGAAEVYRALNVRALCARRYRREGAPGILADLFDMGSSSDAFGAYHHDLRDGESAGIGQESEEIGNALAFWKGRYFVSVMAEAETPEARSAVLDLGRQIASAIREPGSPPDLLGLLPERDLVRSQLRYFHGPLSLGLYAAMAEGNPLRLDEHTEGLLARYRAGSPNARPFGLFVVRYPTPEKAREARDSFVETTLSTADAEGFAEVEAQRWAAVRRVGPLLVGVLDAPTRREAHEALEAVMQRMKGG